MAHTAKDYNNLIGMEGFSETLLKNHFTLSFMIDYGLKRGGLYCCLLQKYQMGGCGRTFLKFLNFSAACSRVSFFLGKQKRTFVAPKEERL